MHEDLKNNTNKQWEKKKHLDDFMQRNKASLSPLEQIEQAIKVEIFFETSPKMLNKNFYRVDNDFLVCALGGEPIYTMPVARFLLDTHN